MISLDKIKAAIKSTRERRTLILGAGVGGALLLIFLLWLLIGILRSNESYRFFGEHLVYFYTLARIATACASFIFGLVLFILWFRAAATEKWAGYIGLAFIFVATQYVILSWLDLRSSPDGLKDFVALSISACSNFLLVSAGLELQDRPPFPKWNFVMQAGFILIGGLLYVIGVESSGFQRFPDAVASAFCILWIGHAFRRNIGHANSKAPNLLRALLGPVVLTSVVLYAAIGFAHATLPLILNKELNCRVVKIVETAGVAQLKSAPATFGLEKHEDIFTTKNGEKAEPVQVVRQIWGDAVIIWILFVLKNVIFLAAFFLLLGALIFVSSRHAVTIFNPISEKTNEFLTNSGFIKFVADYLDAETVQLFVKIPGKKKNQYARFVWPYEQSKSDEPEKIEEAEVDRLALRAIMSGMQQKHPQYENEGQTLARTLALTDRHLPSTIAEPIIFHGAVIGCILVANRQGRTFSRREVRDIKDLVKLSMLSVQAFRETAALDQLNFRFSRIMAPKPVDDFEKAINEVVEILQDVLNPLATGIWLDVGLRRYSSVQGNDDDYCQELRRKVETQDDNTPDVIKLDLEVKIKLDPKDKPHKSPGDRIYKIGKLAILVPPDRDELNCPVLGRNSIHLMGVNTRTISAVLGVVMEHLNFVIQGFGIKVNDVTALNVQQWFSEIEATAKDAGLEWVAVEIPSRNLVLGKPEAIEALRRLQAHGKKYGGVFLRQTPLSFSEGQMLIGVRGSSFHKGGNVCPLWYPSFRRFAEIADAALNRITLQEEKISHLEHQAAHSYEFATVAVTTAEIVHRVANTIRDINLPLHTLREAFQKGKVVAADPRLARLIISLPESSNYLLEMTADFKKLSDPRESPSCNLRQVARQTERFLSLPLKDRDIVLETDIDDDLMVGVPPHIAVLAMVTLVSNAKDAVANGGRIWISAKSQPDTIRCDVIDNGEGVPPEVQARLFHERNVTTKPNGSGWGLYLVERSLNAFRGSIELTASRPGETIFTIYFPKNQTGQ